MAQLTQWAQPPYPPFGMFSLALITRPWRSWIYYTREEMWSFFQLMMAGATPRVVEWPIPWALLGVTSYRTWINGLVLGANGTAWACLGPNTDSRLVELQPSGGLITSFFGLAGAPYDDMHGLAFDGQGALWYGVVARHGRPAIGMFDQAGLRSFVWALPRECSYPVSIWPERNGAAVWFACYNWSGSAGGAFFGRLDPAAGMVDYWSAAGLVPSNFAIAAEPASNAENVWFTSYGYPSPPPHISRVVRFNVASGTFYEYTAPTFLRPAAIDLDRRANAWVAEGENLRFIQKGANCGLTQFKRDSTAVRSTVSPVRAQEERVKPIETPVSASVSSVAPTPENCFENYGVGPATPARLAIDPRRAPRARLSIYFTDPATDTIGRLNP
jgi:streptogramin lyase